jgi:hypothetical protein
MTTKEISQDIDPLGDPSGDITKHYLKGVELYRRVRPLQDKFAEAIEEQNYTLANEASSDLTKYMTEFQSIFYHRPSNFRLGVHSWKNTESLQRRVKRFYVCISDIDRAIASVSLKDFIKFTDKAYRMMFGILEVVKEYAEEGLPIPRHYRRKEKLYGTPVTPNSERRRGRDRDLIVQKQELIQKKTMRRINSQRAKLENWREYTRHHQIEEEEEIEPLQVDESVSQDLNELVKEFEELM